jgi:hypothetical protein
MAEVVASKFGHAFPFKMAKYSIGGAVLGIVSAVLAEVLDKKGKIINKWLYKLNQVGLEVPSLDNEPELCKMYFLIYQNYVKNDSELKEHFQQALDQSCELCFLADQVDKGALNELIPKIDSGDLDPKFDIKIDTEALNLFFDAIEALQKIHEHLQRQELGQVVARDSESSKYIEAKKRYEREKMSLEKRKIDAQMAMRRATTPEAREAVQKTIDELKATPDPIPPQEPSQTKKVLKCDMVDKYNNNIQHHLQRIYKYIKKTVERFRIANPGRKWKPDIYDMEKLRQEGDITRRPANTDDNSEDDDSDEYENAGVNEEEEEDNAEYEEDSGSEEEDYYS